MEIYRNMTFGELGHQERLQRLSMVEKETNQIIFYFNGLIIAVHDNDGIVIKTALHKLYGQHEREHDDLEAKSLR